MSTYARDLWRADNPGGKYPSGLHTAYGDGNFWVEKTDYIRLKNLSLSYSLPQAFVERTKAFKGFRIYAEGQNLWFWTRYTGGDPETDSEPEPDKPGYLPYFNQRTFTMGLDISL